MVIRKMIANHAGPCSGIRIRKSISRTTCGAMTVEMVVALAILVSTVIPISYAVVQERKLARSYYHQAVAMEIIDGEMEILAAGEWRVMLEGPQAYTIRAQAAKNLPPGRFIFTRQNGRLRLEWLPEDKGMGGRVVREAKIPDTLTNP